MLKQYTYVQIVKHMNSDIHILIEEGREGRKGRGINLTTFIRNNYKKDIYTNNVIQI